MQGSILRFYITMFVIYKQYSFVCQHKTICSPFSNTLTRHFFASLIYGIFTTFERNCNITQWIAKLVIIIITLRNTTLFNHLLNLASISGLTTHDE